MKEETKKVETKEKETIIVKAGVLDVMLNSLIVETIKKKEFSPIFSYWLSRIIRKGANEMKEFYEQKKLLIEKYREKEQKGKEIPAGRVTLQEDKIDLFNKEYAELSDIDIKIGFNYLVLDFEKGPKFTLEEMSWLMPFLKEL